MQTENPKMVSAKVGTEHRRIANSECQTSVATVAEGGCQTTTVEHASVEIQAILLTSDHSETVSESVESLVATPKKPSLTKGLSLDVEAAARGRAGTMTTKAGGRKFQFDEVALPEEGPTERSLLSTQDNSLSQKERMELDYLRKRDPMREFFSLVSVLG